MFFKFIRQNCRKVRKENGIYFASLVISIIAFYVILSLGEQDVVVYLKTIESDAVRKLLLLIPVLYAVSLFFVYCLVYFANRYQLQYRSHEFGIYLMMGMKSSKLFAMIMLETLWNGFAALLIGIPSALFLTEIISLSTSRLIGMGIIGHQFRISWSGIGLTIFGFIIVQLFAVLILSGKMAGKEPADLLTEQKEKSQKNPSNISGLISLLFGVAFLSVSYILAVLYLKSFDIKIFALIMFTGIGGTFMIFRGLGSIIGRLIRRKSSSSSGLFIFTGRQLQENVLHQWGSLAVSSLLILLTMVCFAYGVSTILDRGAASGRTADFTFKGTEKEISSVLESDKLKPYVKDYYPMKFGVIKTSDVQAPKDITTHTFSWAGLREEVSKEDDSNQKKILMGDLAETPYLISLSSYNMLLKSESKSPIVLKENEVAMYSNELFSSAHDILRKTFKCNPTVDIDKKQYKLVSELYTSNLVADRAITISYGLIVPDDMYNALTGDSEESLLWNMTLKSDFIEKKGMMQAMQQVNGLLNKSGLHYESYLASMGRQLFYVVAGSYTTLYLGVMFLIIANTVLGLKFLMQQRSTRHRYFTLSMLGADVKSLCLSARTQIWWYFGLSIAVAVISSVFGIWSMIGSFLRIPSASNLNITKVILMAGTALIIFIVFEFGYIWMIQRKSDEEISKLEEIQ